VKFFRKLTRVLILTKMMQQVLQLVSTVKGVITYVIAHYLSTPQLYPKTGENFVLDLAMHIRQGNYIMMDICICKSCYVILCLFLGHTEV
jgi:hypothetical protein